MRYLPHYFPENGLPPSETRKLEHFYEQFVIGHFAHYGQGHFVLACYAALPVVLTPDLMHKLWLNFKQYQLDGELAIIHPVAPADILLSSLVEEIGFELYQMADVIKKALLLCAKKMTENETRNLWGMYSLGEIATFLRDYALYDFTPANSDDDAYREAQEWTALSYLDPPAALRKVVQGYQKEMAQASKLRYKDAIEKMSARFSLNIIQEGAAVPEDYKAATALASLFKESLDAQRLSALEELRQMAKVNEKLLTEAAFIREDVINIEVPEAVGAKLTENVKGREEERKLMVLIVGINREDDDEIEGKVHENSARMFHNVLQKNTDEYLLQLTMLSGREANKKNILRVWEILLTNAGANDDVLLYIAASGFEEGGHCHVYCDDHTFGSQGNFGYLRDEDMKAFADKANCASITLILEVDHSGSSHWLDESNPKNAVIASCHLHQEARRFVVDTKDGSVHAFTHALIQTLESQKGKITNRNLFVHALRHFEKLPSQQKEEVAYNWQIKAPQLLAHSNALDRFFAQGKNDTLVLQNYLRLIGFLNEMPTGKWNTATATALSIFCTESKLSKTLSKQAYITALQGYSKEQELSASPIFLFIFSDPKKKLQHLDQEKDAVLKRLKDVEVKITLQTLRNPTRQRLIDTLKKQAYRNRIQLLYYAGDDDNGSFVLKDGSFTVLDLADWLPFQQNIKLLVANTCRSQQFAGYSTQLGVQMAIGVEGEIFEKEAVKFGEILMQMVANGSAVEDSISKSNLHQRAFRLFKAVGTQNERKPLWDWEKISTTPTKKNYAQRVSALMVAIDEYPQNPLRGCVHGAKQIESQLAQLGKRKEFDITIHKLYNKAATKLSILSAVRQMVSAAQTGEVCLIWFSGHGDNNGFAHNQIIPYDYVTGGSNSLSNEEFYEALQQARGESGAQVVLLLDTHTGYYRWVGDGDILLGGVRHTKQMEGRHGENNPSTLFCLALVEIIRQTKSKITWRHLLLWLRFKIKADWDVKDEIPVLMAGFEQLDTLILKREVVQGYDAPLVAYNKKANAWQVLEEDFKLLPLHTTTTLRPYGAQKYVAEVKGEIVAEGESLHFANMDEGLNEKSLYQASIVRPTLPLLLSSTAEKLDEVNRILNSSFFIPFNAFSKWAGAAWMKQAQNNSWDGLLIDRQNESYVLRLQTGDKESDILNGWQLKMNNLNNLENCLQKFARYHYLCNLDLPKENKLFQPLLVQMHYRWKAEGFGGSAFSRRKIILTEQAFSISGSTITINPLELQIENSEDFPVFCAIYLLSSNLAIRMRTVKEIYPMAPHTTLTLDFHEPQFFEDMLNNNLSSQLKLLASRDPLQIDFSQTAVENTVTR
jgi:hypothetical protein